MDLNARLLEELIYERVRVHVDLLELIDFQRELEDSIARAMRSCGMDGRHDPELSKRYLDLAWRRIEAEWREERSRDEECPLCESPYQCPVGVA
ncbi:MAG TPA: hypothetical protein VMZ28_09415 [Kofleriaceae bacterium]|nr:hypothetical protein [Kofleriaceae bacterium]